MRPKQFFSASKTILLLLYGMFSCTLRILYAVLVRLAMKLSSMKLSRPLEALLEKLRRHHIMVLVDDQMESTLQDEAFHSLKLLAWLSRNEPNSLLTIYRAASSTTDPNPQDESGVVHVSGISVNPKDIPLEATRPELRRTSYAESFERRLPEPSYPDHREKGIDKYFEKNLWKQTVPLFPETGNVGSQPYNRDYDVYRWTPPSSKMKAMSQKIADVVRYITEKDIKNPILIVFTNNQTFLSSNRWTRIELQQFHTELKPAATQLKTRGGLIYVVGVGNRLADFESLQEAQRQHIFWNEPEDVIHARPKVGLRAPNLVDVITRNPEF